MKAEVETRPRWFPPWVVALLVLCAFVALGYAAVHSFLDDESIAGWFLNAVAALMGAAQILGIYPILIAAVYSGVGVHTKILASLERRIKIQPWFVGTSNHWTFWASSLPGWIVGLAVMMTLYYLAIVLPLSIPEIGARAIHLYPKLGDLR